VDSNVSLHNIRLASGNPSEGGRRAVTELPLHHVLFALPCLLAIAILSASLLVPYLDGFSLPSRTADPPTADVLWGVTPTKAEESACIPTCPGCGQPMAARRIWETGEWFYDCKSPGCQPAATGRETSNRPKRD
jgi:hypothetical protein